MTLSEKLKPILEAELSAGNSIEGTYESAFKNTKLLIILKKPFNADYKTHASELYFHCERDTHYPVGESYTDMKCQHAIHAPFNLKKAMN